jgi:hypothetical protein
MKLLRHIWLALFEPWPKHMTSCLFCASVEMPEAVQDTTEQYESDFVFLSGKKCRR